MSSLLTVDSLTALRAYPFHLLPAWKNLFLFAKEESEAYLLVAGLLDSELGSIIVAPDPPNANLGRWVRMGSKFYESASVPLVESVPGPYLAGTQWQVTGESPELWYATTTQWYRTDASIGGGK